MRLAADEAPKSKCQNFVLDIVALSKNAVRRKIIMSPSGTLRHTNGSLVRSAFNRFLGRSRRGDSMRSATCRAN